MALVETMGIVYVVNWDILFFILLITVFVICVAHIITHGLLALLRKYHNDSRIVPQASEATVVDAFQTEESDAVDRTAVVLCPAIHLLQSTTI